MENGEVKVPESYKKTETGIAEIKNNKVISLDGNIEMPTFTVLTGGFNFDSTNLTNYIKDGETATFDVIDASTFLGTSVSTNDMKITAVYNETKLVSLTVTYTANRFTVTLNYVYGNVAG